MLAPAVHDLVATLHPQVRTIAREAGEIALDSFRPGRQTAARIWTKDKGSPVTEADVAVDTFLKIRLSGLVPEAGWLSEETADNPDRLTRRLVWIVDPIDGTRAYMAGSRDWSVAIALLADDRPVLGIVHAPAHERLYEATLGRGARANGEAIAVAAADRLEGARIAGPKPLVDALARRAGSSIELLPKIPSLALRLARVADGSVDVGLVSGNSRDWDLAAADLILHEAGGRVSDLDGRDLRYNRTEPVHGELAAAPARLHPGVLQAMRAATPTRL
jgi:myo-inositol-1(or 4)-monophosphatase